MILLQAIWREQIYQRSSQNLMQQTQLINEKKSGLLNYLLLLTVFFIFVQISLLIKSSNIYFGDVKLVADRLKIPGIVIPGIFYFIFIQLLLHFIYTVFIWGLTRLSSAAWHCSWKTTERLGFGLWVWGVLTILVANQYLFPNSRFTYLTDFIFNSTSAGIFLILSLTIFTGFVLLAIRGAILLFPKTTLITFLTPVIFGLGYYLWPSPIIHDAATAEKPNIIIIGIDSLRPDFLGYFGYEKRTPHLDRFLNQSTVFADALTPIARTFPAWVSILTGEYPKVSGVRFNLPVVDQYQWTNTLPSLLRSQGYETIFSTDETRFSNIDESYGFDKSLTPPIGVNDFLLGNLNDFPLANLIVNTPLGKYFFPHSYGNRPVFMTYDPNSFLRFLEPTLAASRTKPLFFAVHFCLPHYPYFWGTASADDKSINNYRAAVKRVDQQFNDFLKILQKDRLLEHAIVVVLSDHGEAIELPGDRVTAADLFVAGKNNPRHLIPHFYPKSFDFETVDESAGHGTDVLGLTQYHTVLAFRLFGNVKNQIKAVATKVSLLDIKPTLLSFIDPKLNDSKENGRSLKNIILSADKNFSENDFFMESDFSPQAVRSVHPETHALLFEGIDYFQIDQKTGRITVKKKMGDMIISSKQYSDLYKNWILALYPQDKHSMMPILVNLQTGKWTNDLRTDFAKHSPANHMLSALKQFYGSDITSVPRAQ
jgi:arylsulfatase A-like enzyme